MPENLFPAPGDRVMREPEEKQRSGLSRTTRWRLARAGKYPKKRKISDNASGILESEFLQWLAERCGAAA